MVTQKASYFFELARDLGGVHIILVLHTCKIKEVMGSPRFQRKILEAKQCVIGSK